jgi:hypothetical protein
MPTIPFYEHENAYACAHFMRMEVHKMCTGMTYSPSLTHPLCASVWLPDHVSAWCVCPQQLLPPLLPRPRSCRLLFSRPALARPRGRARQSLREGPHGWM